MLGFVRLVLKSTKAILLWKKNTVDSDNKPADKLKLPISFDGAVPTNPRALLRLQAHDRATEPTTHGAGSAPFGRRPGVDKRYWRLHYLTCLIDARFHIILGSPLLLTYYSCLLSSVRWPCSSVYVRSTCTCASAARSLVRSECWNFMMHESFVEETLQGNICM